jgi:3-hydroxymyristoyl/3-hydroxydecanoyl-(acyl carrier protein) dehydratase
VADVVASGLIGADHPALAGHFPAAPVVPAVVLLDFAARALNDALGRAVRITAVPAAKFLSPLLPGQPFTVTLQVDAATRSARFSARTPAAELAQGRLEYADEA